jgi:transposase
MARRTFEVIDLIELYEHWWAGRSQLEISASLGIDPKTIRKYLAPAVEAGLVPGRVPAGREGMSRADWRELAAGWFPAVADAGLRQVTWPAIEVHRDEIVRQLQAGVTQATIHQRLVRDKGLDASVASFRRWVAAHLPEEARRGRVRVPRPPVPPGSEAQIDYGKLGMWTVPGGSRRVAVWAFVMILSCSRHMFVRPVIRLDQHAWSEATMLGFEFFGGVPARIVPDNLKTGVDRPDLYDPKINRSYDELAAHYGTLVDPARAAKPRDKDRVAYCTSSGRCVGGWCSGWSDAGVSASSVWGGRVGSGGLVEDFAFVVIAVSTDKSGVVPDLDGGGGHPEQGGDLGERDEALAA